ncbi:MAG: tetratricopeptide repeat protein [candidate division WOR-3 bacterium]
MTETGKNPAEEAEQYFRLGNEAVARARFIKDLEKAIQYYTRAIELNPKFAEAYFNRWFAYSDKGEYDRGWADYNKAIELNPNITKVLYIRVNTYYN